MFNIKEEETLDSITYSYNFEKEKDFKNINKNNLYFIKTPKYD